MRNVQRIISAFLALALFTISVPPKSLADTPVSAPADSFNLIANPSFESTSPAAGWEGGVGPTGITTWQAAGNPQFAVDSGVSYDGSNSVRITGDDNGDRGSITVPVSGLQAGKAYLLSGWYKMQDVSNRIVVRFQYQRSASNSIIYAVNGTDGPRGSSDWTYFSKVINVAADMKANPGAKVEAFLESSSGTVWFDQFSLCEQVALQDYSLSQPVLNLKTGAAAQFQVVFTPSNASNRFIGWQSSDPATVPVDQSGRVTGQKPGYAVISAASNELTTPRRAVAAVGAPDTLTADAYAGSVAENGALTDKLSAADSGGAPLTFGLALGTQHGKLNLNSDGSFSYYPDNGFSGTDSFTYLAQTQAGGPRAAVATITVQAENAPPVLDMTWYSTDRDTALNGTLGKVTSADPVTWTVAAKPKGKLAVNPDGTFTYTPPAGFTGFDTFQVTATTTAGYSSTAQSRIMVVPQPADFVGALQKNAGSDTHPRLLADSSDFANMKNWIQTDQYMKQWFEKLKAETDPLLDTAPYPYVANGGSNSSIRDLLIHTALMYRLTGDEKYAQRAVQELQSAASFQDWGGHYNSMLSLTYITMGFALAYDWLYDYMTADQRSLVEQALLTKSFPNALDWYAGKWTPTETNNINLVNNGSFSVAALAVLGCGGAVGDAAAQILHGAYGKLTIPLRHLTAGGTWPEGPSYWQFGSEPLFDMISAAQRSLGTDYGLSALDGMEASGNYPLYLWSEQGSFEFSDSTIPMPLSPQSLLLADLYGNNEFAWAMGETYRRSGAYSPYYLLFYRPGMFDEQPSSLDHTFDGIGGISMRSGWGNLNDTYAAMKGFNDTLLSHNDMDAGDFVFDSLGQRWALELGSDDYSLPGYWDESGGQRWQYYRKGAQGQNLMVVNPTANPLFMQDYSAVAPLVKSDAKPRGAYGIVDLTARYPKDAVSYQRGMMLTDNRRQLIVQDEFTLKSPSELYWSMHTGASIQIIENGRAAILTQQDKKLYVKMLAAPAGAAFEAMAAAPLAGTPNPDGQLPIHGIQKLAVHMTNVTKGTLSIWMAPLNESDPLPSSAPAATPLANWSVPDGSLPAAAPAPQADSLLVGGQPVAGFDPQKTYYSVIVPYGAASVPEVTAVTTHTVTTEKASGVPGKTKITLTDPGNPAVSTTYTVAFVPGPIVGNPPDINRIPVSGVTASSSSQASDYGHVPESTIDGDPVTCWTSTGSQWIKYDLGAVKQVGAVSIAFVNGDKRKSYFSISVSQDGSTWSTVYPESMSSGTTTQPEVFYFAPTAARYIRINGGGNTSNTWNNYAEVGIFRPLPVSVSVSAPSSWTVGQQGDLSALYYMYDGTTQPAANVTIQSDSPDVLSVDGAHHAVALRAGTAHLAVTDAEYGLTGTLTVQVADSGIGGGAGGQPGGSPAGGSGTGAPGENGGAGAETAPLAGSPNAVPNPRTGDGALPWTLPAAGLLLLSGFTAALGRRFSRKGVRKKR